MRSFLIRLLSVLVGIVVALSLSEILLRGSHIGHTATLMLYNNIILKRKPHVKFMNLIENRNWVETNNLGFHDRERDPANGNYRVLFLGDSFVEATQVGTDNLFTRRLENMFSRDGHKIECINGGVSGAGTAYEYLLWKEFFEPNIKVDQLVLCVFMGNDLKNNNIELSYPPNGNAIFLNRDGSVFTNEVKLSHFKKVVNIFRDYSAAINTLYESAYLIRRAHQKKNVEDEAQAQFGENKERPGQAEGNSKAWEASVQGTVALIRKWKSELDEKNVPMDIVIIDTPEKSYNRFHIDFIDKLKQICEQDRIGYLRLKLTENPYDAYSFDGKALGHFNYRGHQMAAAELSDYFESHYKEILNQ